MKLPTFGVFAIVAVSMALAASLTLPVSPASAKSKEECQEQYRECKFAHDDQARCRDQYNRCRGHSR